jgi:hypothetical protein
VCVCVCGVCVCVCVVCVCVCGVCVCVCVVCGCVCVCVCALGMITRPPCSPDFTSFDFFFWGKTKNAIYVPPLSTTKPLLDERARCYDYRNTLPD